MSLFQIILRSLRQHMLSTVVTASSIALASGLLMSVWVIKDEAQKNFTGVDSGFHGVFGARGSKLQLVLNSIFHLESSAANLKWSEYEIVKNDPRVRTAIPIAVGDNHKGYRLVGVVTNLFHFQGIKEGGAEGPARGKYAVAPGGRIFDPRRREAVVGSFVADRLGLKPGDTFHPYHGLNFNPEDRHDETYVVVGIMKPTQTPADRVIWIPLKGLQKMSGHEEAKADEVSAVLVALKSPTLGLQMNEFYNRQGDQFTFAWPIDTIVADLFIKIAPVSVILRAVACLVALVAAGAILASIYNSMNERRRDIAILRALGARRSTVFSVIVLEAAGIATLGAAAGFVVYAVIMWVSAWFVRNETGVILEPFSLQTVMIWAPLTMIALGALAGLLPAFKAYRTDVAKHLAPLS